MELQGVFGGVKRNLIKRFFGPERILDLGLRFGPYGGKLNPFSQGLTLRKVKKAVHGIDLGPLASCLPGRLRTADKRVELAPDVLVQDVERVKAKLLDWDRRRLACQPSSSSSLNGSHNSNGSLLLIGRRQLRSNNS